MFSQNFYKIKKLKYHSYFHYWKIVVLKTVEEPVNNQPMSSIDLFSILLKKLQTSLNNIFQVPFSFRITLKIRNKLEQASLNFKRLQVTVNSFESLTEEGQFQWVLNINVFSLTFVADGVKIILLCTQYHDIFVHHLHICFCYKIIQFFMFLVLLYLCNFTECVIVVLAD